MNRLEQAPWVMAAFIVSIIFTHACGNGGGGPGDGASISTDNINPIVIDISPSSGLNLAENVAITVTFDESMDPGSLALGGDMAGEVVDTVWSTTTSADDTLTISGAWSDGTSRTLTVDATDVAGNPMATENIGYDTSVSHTAGDIIITEIMIDPDASTDTDGEWFELYNTTTGFVFDLEGYTIKDTGGDSHKITDSVVFLPKSYVVLCTNSDPLLNGGVYCAYQYTSFALGNAGDEVRLIDNIVSLTMDEVVYSSSFSSVGKAKELSNNHFDEISNDTLANWCDAGTPLPGGDLGTPGVVNDCTK